MHGIAAVTLHIILRIYYTGFRLFFQGGTRFCIRDKRPAYKAARFFSYIQTPQITRKSIDILFFVQKTVYTGDTVKKASFGRRWLNADFGQTCGREQHTI
jgi:hypothetical protein